MKLIEPGQKAPDFEFTDLDGETKKLSELLRKRVILYFYPKDDTPGCTAQACNLRDNISGFESANIRVIGVSMDTEKKHNSFKEKYQLPFVLIPDTEKKIIESYGVWGQKKMMGREYDGILRTTYIIGIDGKIEHRIDKVKTKAHSEQINELLNN
jgi:thioredoxin-dependent peroxiredoxin